MEEYLQDQEIWCWTYRENTRNYPGLHLTARPEGCDALLRALETIRREGNGARRSVPLKPLSPADERKITGGQRFHAFSTLRLVYREETPELRRLAVSTDGDCVLIEVTAAGMEPLRKGIEDVKRGEGDYSIGPPRQSAKAMRALGERDRACLELWFWPCFGHLWPV